VLTYRQEHVILPREIGVRYRYKMSLCHLKNEFVLSEGKLYYPFREEDSNLLGKEEQKTNAKEHFVGIRMRRIPENCVVIGLR
jgi:hypothetical protein